MEPDMTNATRTRKPDFRTARIFTPAELAAMTDTELTEAVRTLRNLEWIASQTRRGFDRINGALMDAYTEQVRRYHLRNGAAR